MILRSATAGGLVAFGLTFAAPAEACNLSSSSVIQAGLSVKTACGPLAPLVEDGWATFVARFVEDGRVVDNANGFISHSEGQGYGMILAARLGDQETFRALWAWTERELMADGQTLPAWRWDPAATPKVADRNNATDGDMLIAWGLLLGADRWSVPEWRTKALDILEAVQRTSVLKTARGPVLLPGRLGFRAEDRADGPVFNPSYAIFPAFEAFAVADPAHDWSGLAEASLRFVNASRTGPLGLAPDWVSLAKDRLTPATGFPPVFGYNAVRIPLYLAMSKMPGARDALQSYSGLWNVQDNVGPFVIDVRSGSAMEPLEAGGYRLIAAIADCIVKGAAIPTSAFAQSDAHYYPAALALLALLTFDEVYPECL